MFIVPVSWERDGLVGIEREQDTTKVVQLANNAENTGLVGVQVGKDDVFVHDGHSSPSGAIRSQEIRIQRAGNP